MGEWTDGWMDRCHLFNGFCMFVCAHYVPIPQPFHSPRPSPFLSPRPPSSPCSPTLHFLLPVADPALRRALEEGLQRYGLSHCCTLVEVGRQAGRCALVEAGRQAGAHWWRQAGRQAGAHCIHLPFPAFICYCSLSCWVLFIASFLARVM